MHANGLCTRSKTLNFKIGIEEDKKLEHFSSKVGKSGAGKWHTCFESKFLTEAKSNQWLTRPHNTRSACSTNLKAVNFFLFRLEYCLTILMFYELFKLSLLLLIYARRYS